MCPSFDLDVTPTVDLEAVVPNNAVTFDIVQQDVVLAVDITVGIPGAKGPQGDPGIVKVTHGSNANTARPTATIVYWVGTVQPVNALPDDLLMLK